MGPITTTELLARLFGKLMAYLILAGMVLAVIWCVSWLVVSLPWPWNLEHVCK